MAQAMDSRCSSSQAAERKPGEARAQVHDQSTTDRGPKASDTWASVYEADPYRNLSEHEPPDSDSRRIRVPLGNRNGRLAMAAASRLVRLVSFYSGTVGNQVRTAECSETEPKGEAQGAVVLGER
jgi:hypothetical protein